MPIYNPIIILGGMAVVFVLGYFAGIFRKKLAEKTAADTAWRLATTMEKHRDGKYVTRL